MIENLVTLVQTKTGISEEQARLAVNTVIGFLKEKMPEPFGSQIDGVLAGDMGDVMAQAESLLGGLFGGKKE